MWAVLAVLATLVATPAGPVHADATLTQAHYRWYANNTNPSPLTAPGSALAAQNTPYIGANLGTIYRLRLSAQVSGAPMNADSQQFRLQFATSVSGPWTDVGSVGATTIWRGSDNAQTLDSVDIDDLLLTSSNVKQTYQENQPSVANRHTVSGGQIAEWDWVGIGRAHD